MCRLLLRLRPLWLMPPCVYMCVCRSFEKSTRLTTHSISRVSITRSISFDFWNKLTVPRCDVRRLCDFNCCYLLFSHATQWWPSHRVDTNTENMLIHRIKWVIKPLDAFEQQQRKSNSIWLNAQCVRNPAKHWGRAFNAPDRVDFIFISTWVLSDIFCVLWMHFHLNLNNPSSSFSLLLFLYFLNWIGASQCAVLHRPHWQAISFRLISRF